MGIASVTKPYTATVVRQLSDEDRLDLDSPVSDFGTDMPRDQPVRVWHLLSHTSSRTPENVYAYDARAFGALTTVVERASGRPFAAEVADRIVRRLRLPKSWSPVVRTERRSLTPRTLVSRSLWPDWFETQAPIAHSAKTGPRSREIRPHPAGTALESGSGHLGWLRQRRVREITPERVCRPAHGPQQYGDTLVAARPFTTIRMHNALDATWSSWIHLRGSSPPTQQRGSSR
jgi:CubicO group peptidase (beta-lactamase class C family)